MIIINVGSWDLGYIYGSAKDDGWVEIVVDDYFEMLYKYFFYVVRPNARNQPRFRGRERAKQSKGREKRERGERAIGKERE